MDAALPWLMFFDPGVQPKRTPHADHAATTGKHLYCAHCRLAITRQDARIGVSGQHAHRFTNPHGFTFEIECFGSAPGCTGVGAATSDYTWFAGYAWRVALCARCKSHLGWIYSAAADRFYGLIRARLVQTQSRE